VNEQIKHIIKYTFLGFILIQIELALYTLFPILTELQIVFIPITFIAVHVGFKDIEFKHTTSNAVLCGILSYLYASATGTSFILYFLFMYLSVLFFTFSVNRTSPIKIYYSLMFNFLVFGLLRILLFTIQYDTTADQSDILIYNLIIFTFINSTACIVVISKHVNEFRKIA
jgi:hypothetical protein